MRAALVGPAGSLARRAVSWVLAALAAHAASAPAWAAPDLHLDEIRLPAGFSISTYYELPNARNLAATPNMRVVLVTDRVRGLYAIVDDDGDFRGDTLHTLQKDLNAPTGVVYRDGFVYVAEQHRVRRAEFDERRPGRLLLWKPVKSRLPDSGHHGTRKIAISPANRLFLAIGVPCNICMPEDDHDAILSMRPEGGGEMVYAKGIRNSVGMDFHPVTGELWFTDNGVDTMGDDLPPDELNRATQAGQHYGYPYYGGGRERTPDFRDRAPPPGTVFPALELQAHAAALGIHFYRGAQFPPAYKHNLFVAQHGSWNRSVPVGYRILRVTFDSTGSPAKQETFAEGWLRREGPWGRPNDIIELGDGSLLVSDDMAGVIYRISYSAR